MGVKGLWTVLEPACEKLHNQERLKHHRIAVDASIWMYQLTKALPTSEVNTQTGAGYNPLVLAGLVRRVCKLLHFGIKPVFVFDGGVPVLKQNTIKDRKLKRVEAESRYKRLAKKMLKIRMSLAAIGASEEPKTSLKDIVPGIVETQEAWSESNESEDGDLDYEQLDSLDIDSPDFKSLPLDLKQELLMALKERTFAEQLGKTAQLISEDALDFSRNQIEALMKRRKIAGELERVSKSGFGSISGIDGNGQGVGHKIASSSTREFVLVKNDSTGGWVFSDTGKKIEEEVKKKGELEEDDDNFERDFFADEQEVEPPKPISSVRKVAVAADSSVEIACPVSSSSEEEQEEDKEAVPISNPFQQHMRHLIEYSDEEEDVLPTFEDLVYSNRLNVSDPIEESPEVVEETFVEEEEPVVPEESIEPIAQLEPSVPLDEYLDKDDEDNFLEEYQYATREELLERLGASLTEARQGMETAQNESGMLGNELLSDFQQLLSLFGLPWMVAPMEAEAQCAWLQHAGLVDGIITDDSDVFLFAPKGTPLLVYRHFFKDKHPVKVYGLPRIGLQMDLNRGDLVVLAFLLGGDYGVGVRGIGAKRGLEILRILKRSETLRARCKAYPEDESGYCLVILNLIRKLVADFDLVGADLTLEDQRALEKLLSQIHHLDDDFPSHAILKAYMEPAVSEDRRPFVWQLPNAASLEKFLYTRLSWSQSQFKNVIGHVLRGNLRS